MSWWKDIELTGDQRDQLLDLRGGCQCAVTRAPCGPCSDPITESEAEELGLGLELAPAAGPDYMKAVRDVVQRDDSEYTMGDWWFDLGHPHANR